MADAQKPLRYPEADGNRKRPGCEPDLNRTARASQNLDIKPCHVFRKPGSQCLRYSLFGCIPPAKKCGSIWRRISLGLLVSRKDRFSPIAVWRACMRLN